MELLQIYQSFSDPIRLRILHLLRAGGPLCVCHFQEILGQPQVRISKHLAYLKTRGLLKATRYQNWMIYALPDRPGMEFEANLNCLQICVGKEALFKKDLSRLARLRPKVNWLTALSGCCPPRRGVSRSRGSDGTSLLGRERQSVLGSSAVRTAKKRRDVAATTASTTKKRRDVAATTASTAKKRRDLVATTASAAKKRRDVAATTASTAKKRRDVAATTYASDL